MERREANVTIHIDGSQGEAAGKCYALRWPSPP